MLTTKEAAAALGIKVRRVQQLIAAGRLPAERRMERGLPVFYIAPADLDRVRDRPTGYPAGKPRK